MAEPTRYIKALKYFYTNKTRHFLIASRRAVAKSIVGDKIQHGAVFSVVRNKRGPMPKSQKDQQMYRSAGAVEGVFSRLPSRLTQSLKKETDDFMVKVYRESQRLVPVDKKYIGKINKRDVGGWIDKDINIELKQATKEQRQKWTYKTSDGFIRNRNEDFYSKFKSDMRYYTIEKGLYSKQAYQTIKDAYLSPNKRAKYSLIEDPLTGHIMKRRYQYVYDVGHIADFSPARGIIYTSKESAGGNMELLKSGKLIKGDLSEKYYKITYNPLERGARWNYAQVQHDNLAYKHTVGEALYLWKAFEKYKNDFYEAVRKKTVKEFKESIKNAYI